jgi:hypothetical protein
MDTCPGSGQRHMGVAAGRTGGEGNMRPGGAGGRMVKLRHVRPVPCRCMQLQPAGQKPVASHVPPALFSHPRRRRAWSSRPARAAAVWGSSSVATRTRSCCHQSPRVHHTGVQEYFYHRLARSLKRLFPVHGRHDCARDGAVYRASCGHAQWKSAMGMINKQRNKRRCRKNKTRSMQGRERCAQPWFLAATAMLLHAEPLVKVEEARQRLACRPFSTPDAEPSGDDHGPMIRGMLLRRKPCRCLPAQLHHASAGGRWWVRRVHGEGACAAVRLRRRSTAKLAGHLPPPGSQAVPEAQQEGDERRCPEGAVHGRRPGRLGWPLARHCRAGVGWGRAPRRGLETGPARAPN